jgi:hypothetical protein
MKLILSFIFFGFPFLGLCQVKVKGTLITTPRASYFIQNKVFCKNDSSLLIAALTNDTLIHASIGGHRVHETLMDSISIQYNWAKENEDDYIKDEKLYYRCIYIVFDLYTILSPDDLKAVDTHLIYLNGIKVAIRSRFRWVSDWDYCE